MKYLRPLRSLSSLVLSLSLLLGPTVALAAPPGAEPPPAEGTPEGPVASDEDKAESERLSEQAKEEFGRKNYLRAVELFEQAYALDPQPNYLFNIGRVYEEAGELEKAVEFYGKFVKQPGVSIDYREAALERLRVLRGVLAETEQPDEKPPEDKAPEPEVEDPEPVQPPTEQVDEQGERKRKAMRGAGFGLLGVGAGALIGGAVLGGLASGDNRKAEDAGTPDERRDLLDGSRTKALTADVLYGVGGALVLTGVILVALGYAKPKAAKRVAMVPSFGPRGGGLNVHLRF